MCTSRKQLRRLLFFAVINPFIFASGIEFNPENYISREITAIRLTKPLKIDGFLDENLYQDQPIQTFIQVDPDNGELASENTDVWIAYDDEALYVGARLWDSKPDSIVGRIGRRDSDLNSDQFQVAIDSYNDKRSGFFFFINPSGAIQDGTISNDSWFDDTWDGIWDSKTRVDKKGWIVEMRIPFSQLRFNNDEELVWGIGLGRIIQRRNEQVLNVYIPRGESGLVSRFATLKGIHHIKPQKRLEFFPYLTSGYGFLPSEEDNPFFNGHDSDFKFGTDLKLGIGNNLTVDVTINPDFGQVEVDPSVINLSAYETYYQEKRPFFIEGANIFSFGSGGPTNRWGFNFFEPNFFYSRRIGRFPQSWVDTDGWVDMPEATSILGAAKLSGKLKGDWSVGGITAVTNREHAQVHEDGNKHKVEVEPSTIYNLIRTQKEFQDGYKGLGIIGTYVSRNFKDSFLKDVLSKNATAIGIDGWTFFGKDREWVIAGWSGWTKVTGSETQIYDLQQNSSHYFQRPDADHVSLDSTLTQLSGYAGRLIINKEKGHVTFNTALGIISPGFESNDMGLTFGTDRINKHLVLGYRWYDPGKVFRSAAINTAYMSNHNFGGYKINESVFLFGYAQLLNYWSFDGFMAWGPRTISDTKLRGGPMVISPSGIFLDLGFDSDNRKNVIFSFGGNRGKSEKGGQSYSIYTELELKVGNQLNLTAEPMYSVDRSIDQYVTSVDDKNAKVMYGIRYIVAQLDQKTFSTDIRIDYAFTPTLSIQSYFQPFIAVGHYSRFKEFKKPKSYDFLVYGEEGTSISTSISEEENQYLLDPTGGDDGDSFYIDNPDFNYKALVGNVVLRWEFKPGSTLYFVWTRNGSDSQNIGDFQFKRDFSDIFKATTDNIFAIKVTYWLG